MLLKLYGNHRICPFLGPFLFGPPVSLLGPVYLTHIGFPVRALNTETQTICPFQFPIHSVTKYSIFASNGAHVDMLMEILDEFYDTKNDK